MIPERKVSVSVDGYVCNGRNCLAVMINDSVVINPPPIRGASILVIYKHKNQPFKQTFTGDGFSTVFTLAHKPDL